VTTKAVENFGAKSEEVGHCVLGNFIHSARRDMHISGVAGVRGCKSIFPTPVFRGESKPVSWWICDI